MYIIKIRDTVTNAVSYIPEGFGFTVHAHTLHRDKAARFATVEKANRYLAGYIHPPAFWECERRHRENMERKSRAWECSVEKIKEMNGHE